MTPLFIFSLPRSGSTLLQRMLSASDEISTVSEPWILLPFIYLTKKDGALTEYWHCLMAKAVADFHDGFPQKQNDYYVELRRFILNLYYKRVGKECKYFLDKTPRYHLICKEIIEVFPDAKFIFLWRNPLSIVASILNSWTKGKWKICYYNIDLYKGFDNLVRTYKKNADISHSLQYEKMIEDPKGEIAKICDYLDVEYDDKMIEKFQNVILNGQMGDRLGVNKYNKINFDPLEKWKKAYGNAYRRLWARRYLEWIGNRLETIGYHKEDLLKQIDTSKGYNIKGVFQDLCRTNFYKWRNTISGKTTCKKEKISYILN